MLSKIGGRAANEDACGFWTAPEACFCALSDGLGGHHGGDVASKIAVKGILDWFRETPECSAGAVRSALQAGNSAVIQAQARDSKLGWMRTTAVVLSIDTRRSMAVWGHSGDSRLYCFRAGRIIEQTSDHSVLQSLVDAGYLQPGELRTSPNRSRLLAALGEGNVFEMSVRSPELALLPGDVFLLCTDGFWEYVEEEEMEQALDTSACAPEWMRILEKQILMRGPADQDNYSAIAVWCSKPLDDGDPVRPSGAEAG